MIEQQGSAIDYYVWLLSDWAYLGGVRFVQLAKRHGLKITDAVARRVCRQWGYPAWKSLVATSGVPHHRIEAMALPARHSCEHRAQVLPMGRGFGLLHGDRRAEAGPTDHRL